MSILFGVQSSRCVYDHDVLRFRFRMVHRIVCDRSWITAFLVCDHGAIDPLTPDFELLDRGGPERVSGGHHNALAHGLKLRSQLRNGCGLARAVHSHHAYHAR